MPWKAFVFDRQEKQQINYKTHFILNNNLLLSFPLSAWTEKPSEIKLTPGEQAILAITQLEHTAVALEWMPLKVKVSDVSSAELADEKLPAQWYPLVQNYQFDVLLT